MWAGGETIEKGACVEKLGIDPRWFLSQLVNFIVLLIVLQRFLYKPMLAMLQQRQERIREGMAQAEQAKKEAQRAEADYQKRIEDARREGQAIITQASVQAETCDECGHYLKIVHTDRDPFIDPVADDLASLTLDLLVSETGMTRHGVNLMLLFGESEPPPDPASA